MIFAVGIIVVLGNTYTGRFDPVQKVSALLDEYEEETGVSIPIHVDAASGGFVAPFLDQPSSWWYVPE